MLRKKDQINKRKAEGFYSIHKDKPFFKELIHYMISGPIIVQVLKGDNALRIIGKLWEQLIQKMQIMEL